MRFANFIFILIGFALISATHFYKLPTQKQKGVFLSPPPYLSFFSFGQQMVFSDLMWIRVIFDIDYCDNMVNARKCRAGNWLFLTLDQLTNLGPDNVGAYREGGLALSVLLDDIPGGTKIFDKGLAVIQSDWNLFYRAAYHSLLEEKNRKKAAERFYSAAKLLGAKGEWFYNIAGRLYKEEGQEEMGREVYEHMKTVGVSEGFLKRMREKLNITEDSTVNPGDTSAPAESD